MFKRPDNSGNFSSFSICIKCLPFQLTAAVVFNRRVAFSSAAFPVCKSSTSENHHSSNGTARRGTGSSSKARRPASSSRRKRVSSCRVFLFIRLSLSFRCFPRLCVRPVDHGVTRRSPRHLAPFQTDERANKGGFNITHSPRCLLIFERFEIVFEKQNQKKTKTKQSRAVRRRRKSKRVTRCAFFVFPSRCYLVRRNGLASRHSHAQSRGKKKITGRSLMEQRFFEAFSHRHTGLGIV